MPDPPPPESPPTEDDAPEFRGEFETELVRWFRRRFGWLCAAYAIVAATSFLSLLTFTLIAPSIGRLAAAQPSAQRTADPSIDPERDRGIVGGLRLGFALREAIARDADGASDRSASPGAAASPLDPLIAIADAAGVRAASIDAVVVGVGLLAILHSFRRVRPRIESRATAISAATRLLIVLGGLTLAGELAKRFVSPEFVVSPLLQLMTWHLSACLFLPWSPRESVRPMLPLLAAWGAFRIASGSIDGLMDFEGLSGPLLAVGEVAASPAILLPGMGLCWWRLRRYRRRFGREFAGRQLRSLKREIKQARAIHDSLFPPRIDEGPVRFDYAFAPAGDLGGDFLHLVRRPDGRVQLVLLDVTGHGLSSAMTVNRLVGELERLHAERPGLGPGELLAGLNRYVHLTLLRHSILATALAIEIDPGRGLARIANAGHPPLLCRDPDGRIEVHEANEPILGALPPAEFGDGETTIRIRSGSVLFLYTDGAFEARDRRGRELGLEGFIRLCRHHPPPPRWSRHLLAIVEGFEGPVRGDDVLIATLEWTGAEAPVDDRAPLVGPSRHGEPQGANA